MRKEIKLRAWDGKRMKFCGKGGECDFIIEGGEISLFGEFDLRERTTPGWPLMEYTGVNDKNGVEICEGDIVQCVDDNYTPTLHGTFKIETYLSSYGREFSWEKISGYDCPTHIMGNFDDQNNSLDQTEVIGNIHQNPELLEA